MNEKRILRALGNVENQYIEEAEPMKKTEKKNTWQKWAAVAACLAIIVAVALPLSRITHDKLPTEDIQIIVYNYSYYEVCDDKKVLKRLGMDANISEADAGEMITYLTKKIPGGKSEYIPTTDKTDIILYSYAAAHCDAVYVICDNGEYDAVVFCNYILPDTETVSIGMLYSLYNIKSPQDISSISVVDDWFKKNIIGTTITDENAISDFYFSSIKLQDYSNNAYNEINYGHIDTEEKLLQAYEKTDENKLTIMLETSDGLRFCLEYDSDGGWIYSNNTLRYYRVTEEMAAWFSNSIK